MNNLSLFLIPFFVATSVSFLSVPLIIRLAWKLSLIDDPHTNKHPKVLHTTPLPRAGGLGIFFSLLVSSLIFLPLDHHLVGILAGATILTLAGLLDDLYNINPYLRLLISLFAAALPVATGIDIAFVNNPLTGQIVNLSHPQLTLSFLGHQYSFLIIAIAIALGWITFLLNAVSIGAKGIDGQLPGTTAIAAFIIALLSAQFSADITQWPITILAAITCGAFSGFLPWNIYPQKILPGWSGGTLAGYLLAILSILSTTKVGTLLVVLSIPLADVTWSIARRIKAGRSPVWGDRGHLHHLLLDFGLPRHYIAPLYWLLTLTLGLVALQLNSRLKFYTIIGVILLVGGIIWWLNSSLASSAQAARGKSSKT